MTVKKISDNILPIVTVLFVCILVLQKQCGQSDYPQRLAVIDSLISVNPDKARLALTNLAADTADMAKSQRMYYKLLGLKVRIPYYEQTESVVHELTTYYRNGGDPNLLPQVYYYAARTYLMLGERQHALELFKMAVATANISDSQLKKDAQIQIRNLVGNTTSTTDNNSLYKYHTYETENAHLKIERQNYVIVGLVVVIIIFFMLSIFIVYGIKTREDKKKLKLKLLLLDKLQKEQKEKLDIADENKQKVGLKQDIQRQQLVNTEAYAIAKIRIGRSLPISIEQWKNMENELTPLLGNFKLVLNQAYELKESEYRICLLIKLGFKNAEIATLISRSPNAVSQARKRLYKKITGKNGLASDLDEIIKTL